MKQIPIWLILIPVLILSETVDQALSEAGRLIDERKYKEAIACFERELSSIQELEPHQRSRAFNSIGFCYMQTNQFSKAEQYYQLALLDDADYIRCLNNMAALQLRRKKYSAALPYLDHAFSLDAAEIKVILNLCTAHYRLGHKEKTEYYLRIAYRIDPAYTRKRLHDKGVPKKYLRMMERELSASKN